MSKDPSQPEQGEASQPQASTSGTNQQTQSSKDGTNPASESTNRPAQRDSGADSATAGHSGNGEQSKEEKNETPDELRQELDQLRRDLAASLQKKQSLDRQLVSHESAIYAFETSYLSVDLSAGPTNATFGNIVKGYDSYLKSGAAAAEASRKKQSSSSTRGHGGLGPGYATGIVGPGGALFEPVQDADRLFSRSSVTYQDSLHLRDRDQAHLMGMLGGSGGNTGNNTASEVEELDDGDDQGNDSVAGQSTSGSTPLSANAPQSTSSNKDKDGPRDPKRPKKK